MFGRKSIKKALVLQISAEKVLKNNWFYRYRPKNNEKSIGFIDIVRKHIKKALVLFSKGKTVKKQEEKNKKCKIVIFSREKNSHEAILIRKIKKPLVLL